MSEHQDAKRLDASRMVPEEGVEPTHSLRVRDLEFSFPKPKPRQISNFLGAPLAPRFHGYHCYHWFTFKWARAGHDLIVAIAFPVCREFENRVSQLTQCAGSCNTRRKKA